MSEVLVIEALEVMHRTYHRGVSDCPCLLALPIARALVEVAEAAKEGQVLIEDMDRRMPEQATEDEDGWINSYRIPVGPWHRILGWSRGRMVGKLYALVALETPSGEGTE